MKDKSKVDEVVNKQLTRQHAFLLLRRQPKIKNVKVFFTTLVGEIKGLQWFNRVLEHRTGEKNVLESPNLLKYDRICSLSQRRPLTSAELSESQLPSLIFRAPQKPLSNCELVKSQCRKFRMFLMFVVVIIEVPALGTTEVNAVLRVVTVLTNFF